MTSPDRVLDAVLVEVNGGATTSFGYDIHVVARGDSAGGRPVASLYGAARSDSAYGANLRWGDERTLAVEFFSAREVTRHVSSIEVADRTVRVALRSGVSDPTAPPGGMLYNLQGRPHDRPVRASGQPQ